MGYIEDTLMDGEIVFYKAKLHWITLFKLKIIKYFSSEFGITNKRIIMKTGFIRRNSQEILITKAEGIRVNQGFFGRLLNYGTVNVTGTGGAINSFSGISSPVKFRNKAQEQMESVNLSRL